MHKLPVELLCQPPSRCVCAKALDTPYTADAPAVEVACQPCPSNYFVNRHPTGRLTNIAASVHYDNMSEYRRYFVPGGTYFFTLVTHRRRRFLCESLARQCLRAAIKTIQKDHPFEMPALVLLPDHLHTIWNLPPGDARYATRWRRIKEEFTRNYLAGGGREGPVSASRKERGERGLWQRRYWEHTIDDEHDFDRHFDYIHYNPKKHGYVQSPGKWPHSSFHRWVKRKVYEPDWGSLSHGALSFDDLEETAME